MRREAVAFDIPRHLGSGRSARGLCSRVPSAARPAGAARPPSLAVAVPSWVRWRCCFSLASRAACGGRQNFWPRVAGRSTEWPRKLQVLVVKKISPYSSPSMLQAALSCGSRTCAQIQVRSGRNIYRRAAPGEEAFIRKLILSRGTLSPTLDFISDPEDRYIVALRPQGK